MGETLNAIVTGVGIGLGILGAGCKTVQSYTPMRTNTAAMREGATSYVVRPYSIDEVTIGGERYMAIKMSERQTAKVNNTVLSRDVILDAYLIPFSNSDELIRSGKVNANSDEVYALANVVYQDGNIALNTGKEPQETRVVHDRGNLETRVTDKGKFVSTRRTPRNRKKISDITINRQKYLIMAIEDETIKNITRLPVLLMNSNSEEIVTIERNPGSEKTERSIQGFQYVPIRAELVDYLPESEANTPRTQEPVE